MDEQLKKTSNMIRKNERCPELHVLCNGLIGLIVFVVIVGFMYFIGLYRPDQDKPLINTDQLFDTITCYVAIVSAIYALYQYYNYTEREKYEKLSRLSERFASDKNIKRVVKSLIACYNEEYGKKFFNISTFEESTPKKNETDKIPSEKVIFERELFLRFFEEIQYALDTGSLDKEIVCYYFAYYAVVASLIGEKFVEDYNDITWKEFRIFADDMAKIAKKEGYFSLEPDNKTNPTKILIMDIKTNANRD